MNKMRTVISGLIVIAVLMAAISLSAEPWSKSLDLNFTMTQNSYSDSWTGGEAGSISWVSNANGTFQKQMSQKFNFKNTTKLSFGQTHIQDKDTKQWAKPIKSTDLIDIENVGKFTMGWLVDPYASLRFETEFYDGSVSSIKRYFSPAKITESAGLARTITKTPANEVNTRLGFALRQIITSVVKGDTLLKQTESKSTNDGGIESVTDAKFTLTKTLSLVSKLSLYKALFYSKSKDLKGTPQANYWKMVDVNWENQFSAAVAKYVTVSLYAQLLYDKEISKRGRFKETLALGLTYKMF
jgi:hypothetical protein